MNSVENPELSYACDQQAEIDALRAQVAELAAACKSARLAVEDYITRIERHGFQPTFGRNVLATIDAALAKVRI